ncbi:MAPEG family protein [Sphingomicrobium marinum]|uniref:MAPEG family protein n=1 Tax=Sphingomicrobium marinum TaxID=1227950 RepID=UPI00223F8C5C|nr:MAPEG family protein [Sphingomicrobium marinum]
MTVELTYLSWAALLTALLWMPYIVGLLRNSENMASGYVDPTPPANLPAWVKRANRTHINSVETLTPFAVFVLVLHVTDQHNSMTAMWAMVFFWARVAHAIVYWLAIPYVRTLAFLVALVATLGLFWEVIT